MKRNLGGLGLALLPITLVEARPGLGATSGSHGLAPASSLSTDLCPQSRDACGSSSTTALRLAASCLGRSCDRQTSGRLGKTIAVKVSG